MAVDEVAAAIFLPPIDDITGLNAHRDTARRHRADDSVVNDCCL